MPEKRGKILVIRGGAIGDFILTLPAIAALRSTFQNSHLELLGYTRVAELAQAAGIIDAFRSIEARPLARFFAKSAKLDEEWSAYFDTFNLIISYLYDPDEIFKTNVGRASKAQFIQALHRPDENVTQHATEVFLKPLERLAIFDADPMPRLCLPSGERPGTGRWLAAHPGSGSEKKNWPVDKWKDLLRRVIETTSCNVLLVGGEAEGSRLQEASRALPADRMRTALSLPLAELGALLAHCAAFVGHDSGITHLASAVGLNCVVLWGPSRQEIWRPLNPGVQIVSAGPHLDDLSVDTVWPKIAQMLPVNG